MNRGKSDTLATERELLLSALTGVSFDLAIFFEHSKDDEQGNYQSLFCPRIVLDREKRPVAWPQRWQPVLPRFEQWVSGDAPWFPDLCRLKHRKISAAGTRFEELPIVRSLCQFDIRSVLSVASQEGSRVAASLLLGSKQIGAYGSDDLKKVHSNDIRTTLTRLIDGRRERRAQLLRDVRTQFQPDRAPESLAAAIVERLAVENDWDFVGIYRVEDKFSIIASCDRTPDHMLQIDADYRQDLEVGMLGYCLAERRCLRADDVTTDPAPYNYSPVEGFSSKSALCYPISVQGHVEWILDCASTATAAFRGPDMAHVTELVQGLQSTLELWFEGRLSRSLLDGLSKPVLVIDHSGVIQRANNAALALFGEVVDSNRSVRLQDLAADAKTRGVLGSVRSWDNHDVKLLTGTQHEREMLVTARRASEAFGHYVLQFTSKGEDQWLAGLDFARDVVEKESGEARALLLLANALIMRFRSDLKGHIEAPELDDKLVRLSEIIKQADLSYDKLGGALTGARPPGLGTLLVGLLEVAQSALPLSASEQAPEKFSIGGADVVRATTFVANALSSLREVSRTTNVPADPDVAIAAPSGAEIERGSFGGTEARLPSAASPADLPPPAAGADR